MKQSLSSATSTPFDPIQLVFASDWNAMLPDLNKRNYELLKFLSDVKKAEHHVVIITSIANIDDVRAASKAFLRSLGREGYNAVDETQFKFMTQEDWDNQKLKSDYSFPREDCSDSLSWLNELREMHVITRHQKIVAPAPVCALG